MRKYITCKYYQAKHQLPEHRHGPLRQYTFNKSTTITNESNAGNIYPITPIDVDNTYRC